MAEKIRKIKGFRQVEIRKINNMLESAILSLTNKDERNIFKAMVSDIEDIKSEFRSQHDALLSLVFQDEEEFNDALSVMSEFDKTVYKIRGYFETLFNENQSIKLETSVNPSHINLPKIELFKFKGDIQSFPTFLDMYDSLVHNNTALSSIEKFNYLISSLEGPPLSLVKCLPMSSANYEIAYNSLLKRYKNKRLLSQAHWSAIENLPKLNSDDPQALRNLLDIFSENLEALNILEHPVDKWDFILAHTLLKKIDNALATRFELHHSDSSDTMPKYTDVYKFLENHCNALFTLDSSSSKSKFKKNETAKFPRSTIRPVHASTSFLGTNNNSNNHLTTHRCVLCNNNHALYKCPDFNSKSPNERFQYVKFKHLCINCLSNVHRTINCNSTSSCRTCRKRHHTLLHFDRTVGSSNSNNADSQLVLPDINASNSRVETQTQTLASFSRTTTAVLLSTALVEVLDNRGHYQKIRAIIDTGSQTSLITQKCANRLGLPRNKIYSEIQGIGEMGINSHLGCVSLSIRHTNKTHSDLLLNAIILPRICSDLPSTILPKDGWNHIKNLNLADPEFYKPGTVDLLLGADLFPLIIRSGRVLGNTNEPIALDTIFGFILMGKFENNHLSTSVTSLLGQTQSQPIDKILSKFWELESIPQPTVLSPEDELCDKKYLETVSRNSENRFIVSLPFRDEEPSFPGSRNIALNHFLTLERRLLKNPTLYAEYSNFLQEYLDLNHMELLSDPVCSDKSFYIPHHCVLKPDSLSTRIRVVFNASIKINNLSLNDTLLVGQKLQKDIVQILLNFRLHPVVLTADIQKMYRQILVNSHHQDYQRILWRFNPSSPVLDFRLRTVTYGISSAPYLALRTLLKLSEDEKDNFPRAAKVLKHDTYIDDIVTGCLSVEDAISLQNELTLLLQKGGFELHKWATNKPEVLSHLPAASINPASLSLDSDEVTKVLGLCWQPSSDTFTYKVTPNELSCTKRHILSELARVFDPLGFLTPVTFSIKYLIQKLWVLGLDWDDTPPSEIVRVWTRYKNELPLLSNFHLPRLIDFDKTVNSSLELHGFCDSSERGYAAITYLRTYRNDGYFIYFICSKSRVAPLKTISIPRLELCAAVLLAELIEFVLNTYTQISFNKIYCWTDSTVALSWIKSHPHRWKTFVSNRVSFIQERVDPQDWHHVGSAQNPADIASRGAFPSELMTNSLWWAAPDFLQNSIDRWPMSKFNLENISEVQSEEKKNIILSATNNDTCNFLDKLLLDHSSLNSIKRILGYILRFINNCRFPNKKIMGNFSYKELNNALLTLVKREQQLAFSTELSKLNNNQKLPKPFQKLNVFIDEQQILRVGGRLHYSALLYDKKHPALLPRQSRLTFLIIETIHKKYMHAGLQTVQYLLYQNFWILSAKRAIRHVLSNCLKCFKVKPKSFQPLMGNLPSPRILPNKCFLHSGVDYAGPFHITLSKIRGAKTYKAYVCLFVCLSTKAIHIELVSDLTSNAFLAALRRFIARRGRVSHLYSDNGTNFVKANKDLILLTRSAASTESIEWHFIPPSAPHFGGLWEAGVKCMKGHLIRVIGNQILTYEEFYTILCQIEAILNSRPLTPLSSDPNDLSVLTPGHFLTMEPLTTAPDSDLTDVKFNCLNRWQLLQRIQQDIWSRWHREYLHTLQQRSKWLDVTVPPEIGSLVLIKDNCTPPLKWRLGRICALYPGADGIARVADVNTIHGLMKRPLSKLCPLPVFALENA